MVAGPSVALGERASRSVDHLLRQAETASGQMDWVATRSYATAALSFDPENVDAKIFLATAERNLAATPALVLSPARIIAFSLLAPALYVFYWSYFTWKQLQPETRERHFPVWHALTLMVPIYGLFRMHKHLEEIEELALRANVSSISPMGGVVLMLIGGVVNAVSTATLGTPLSTALLLVVAVLYGLVVFLAQSALTQVWRQRGQPVRGAEISWVEVVLVLVGLLSWFGTLPAS
jgi:hypothetical protein